MLINQIGSRSQWIGLSLLTREGRAAIGAEVRMHRADQTVLRRTVRRTIGYLSSSDPRLILGLGASAAYDSLEIRWPDGESQELSGLAVGQYHLIRQSGDSRPAQAGTGDAEK